MKRWLVGVAVLVFFIIGGIGIWLYSAAGLKEFLAVIGEIKRLPQEQEALAWDNFFNLGEPNLYGGTLAGFWGDKVWVWGKRGLRSFQPDEFSVYSFFSACTPEIAAKIQENKPFSLKRSVETEFESWKEKAKRGQYATVLIAAKENGGTAGNLREVYGYDWRPFMPKGNLRELCEK